MKEQPFKNTEEAAGLDNLLKQLHALRDEENARCTPPPFDDLWERIAQESQPRARRTLHRRFSPWWLVAACFIGIAIGFALPRPWDTERTGFSDLGQLADTVSTPLGESLSQENFPLHLVVAM